MTMRDIVTAQHCFALEGTGYEPHGAISVQNTNSSPEKCPVLTKTLQAALLCNDAFIYIKGAPERVLEMCTAQQSIEGEQPLNRTYWLQTVKEMAQQGQRVLAIALKPKYQGQQNLQFGDVEQGLVMLGLFGLIDPPRQEAIAAIEKQVSASK